MLQYDIKIKIEKMVKIEKIIKIENKNK